MSTTSRIIAVGSSQPPANLDPSAGRIVWLDVRDATVQQLISAVQQCLPTDRLTVVAAWPGHADDLSTYVEQAMFMTEVATGVVQSVQFELGGQGTTTNLVVASADQIDDVQRTIDYFHGPDGGYVAGCTFDLRPTEAAS